MTRVGRGLAFALALVLGALCAVPSFVTAAPGDLDTSFGGDGTVLGAFGTSRRVPTPWSSPSPTGSYRRRRYPLRGPQPAGSSPSRAGSQTGRRTRDSPSMVSSTSSSPAGAWRRQRCNAPGPMARSSRPAPSSTPAGRATAQFALLRLTAAGVPDTSFSSDGEVTTEFAGGNARGRRGHRPSRRYDRRRRRARHRGRLRVRHRTLRRSTARSSGRRRRSSPRVPPAVRTSSSSPIASSPSGRSTRRAGPRASRWPGTRRRATSDPTFGNGGTQVTAFVGGDALGRGAVLASTGEILVAGDFTLDDRRHPVRARALHRRWPARHHVPDRGPDIDTVQPEQRVRGRRCPGALRGAGHRRPRLRIQLRPSGVRTRRVRRRRDAQPRVRHRPDADDTVRHGRGIGNRAHPGARRQARHRRADHLEGRHPVRGRPVRGVLRHAAATSASANSALFRRHHPPPPPPPPARAALATIKTTAALLRDDRTVRIALQCRTVRLARCRGMLRLTALPRSTPSRGGKGTRWCSSAVPGTRSPKGGARPWS